MTTEAATETKDCPHCDKQVPLDATAPCPDCGHMLRPGGFRLHSIRWCKANPDRMNITDPQVTVTGGKRKSRRGRAGMSTPDVFDQIPHHPGGAWAYYLRDDALLPEEKRTYPATINEVLVTYPNGGSPGSKRFGRNAEYYHARQRKRGLRYLGSNLNADAVKELVQTVVANREDYNLYLREQIVEVNGSLDEGSGLSVEQRDQQKRRRSQLEGQLRLVDQPLNAATLTKQLNDIAEAQQLAGAFTPTQLAVLKGMIGSTVAEVAMRLQETRIGDISDAQEPILSNSIDLT